MFEKSTTQNHAVSSRPVNPFGFRAKQKAPQEFSQGDLTTHVYPYFRIYPILSQIVIFRKSGFMRRFPRHRQDYFA